MTCCTCQHFYKILNEELVHLLTLVYCIPPAIMAQFMHVREYPKVYNERLNRDEVNPIRYRKLFRFNRENVEWLAQTFLPENNETIGLLTYASHTTTKLTGTALLLLYHNHLLTQMSNSCQSKKKVIYTYFSNCLTLSFYLITICFCLHLLLGSNCYFLFYFILYTASSNLDAY